MSAEETRKDQKRPEVPLRVKKNAEEHTRAQKSKEEHIRTRKNAKDRRKMQMYTDKCK
jgi:hypothetical protein